MSDGIFCKWYSGMQGTRAHVQYSCPENTGLQLNGAFFDLLVKVFMFKRSCICNLVVHYGNVPFEYRVK
jgi:hypothetical protein